MTIYTIKSNCKATKNYTPSVFYVNRFINGEWFIACENDEIGFCVRNDMTIDRLTEHLENMKKSGFSVTATTVSA